MKTIRNTTGSDIDVTDVGVTIAAGSTYTIVPVDFPLWAASVSVDSPITSGSLVVNDGYDDLQSQAGLYHIHEEGINRSSAFASTASVQNTANITTTLTAASRILYIYTGTVSGQIVKLPSALTLPVGWRYEIWNTSNQTVTINNNANTTLFAMAAFQKTWVTLQVNTTAAGTWLFEANFLGGTGGGNGTMSFGFDGNGSTGRWLESLTDVASNRTGYIIAGSKSVRSISIGGATGVTYTATVTIFKNGVALDTITLTAARKNTKVNLNLTLVNLDEISAQITSGSITRPVVVLWL